MSLVIDTSDLQPGSLTIGVVGLGVLGSTVPSAGRDGPPPLYNDVVSNSLQANEVRMLITAWPTLGGTLFANEDSSFVYSGGPDSFTYTLYVDGVASGSAVVSLGSSNSIGGAIALADAIATGAFTTFAVPTLGLPPDDRTFWLATGTAAWGSDIFEHDLQATLDYA